MASMSDKQMRYAEREAQRLKKAILLVSLLILLLVVGALSVILNRYLEKQESQDRNAIYGVWVEQGVPKFARDRFVVREDAIYIDERIVDTQYTFDGSELRYEYEEQQFVYKIKDQDEEEGMILLRVEPTHYLSTFKLQGVKDSDETGALSEVTDSL
ncbi:DUF2850 domain-containing protein [Vibrio sp. HN007]|uniref:DUF2850 domain-containing protein n=1 Tax=Vibrio iocasae TaxID=3098914 RepID=UPI0035D4843E